MRNQTHSHLVRLTHSQLQVRLIYMNINTPPGSSRVKHFLYTYHSGLSVFSGDGRIAGCTVRHPGVGAYFLAPF